MEIPPPGFGFAIRTAAKDACGARVAWEVRYGGYDVGELGGRRGCFLESCGSWRFLGRDDLTMMLAFSFTAMFTLAAVFTFSAMFTPSTMFTTLSAMFTTLAMAVLPLSSGTPFTTRNRGGKGFTWCNVYGTRGGGWGYGCTVNMRRCGGRDSRDFIIFLIRILRFHHSLYGGCGGGAVSGSQGCGRCGSASISSIFMRYDIYNTVRYMQHMRTLQQPHQTWLLINTSL